MTLYEDTYRIETARLCRWNYRDPGAYFVTICTKDHVHFFGDIAGGEMRLSECGAIADLHLRCMREHYGNVDIHCYIVMPNHIHAIILIGGKHLFSPHIHVQIKPSSTSRLQISPQSGSLAQIIRSYKSGVAHDCHLAGFTGFAWQPRYYDHIIRSDASLHAITDYIGQNPKNWPHDPEKQVA